MDKTKKDKTKQEKPETPIPAEEAPTQKTYNVKVEGAWYFKILSLTAEFAKGSIYGGLQQKFPEFKIESIAAAEVKEA